ERVIDDGAEIEKKPDRQIAEWGAELETVERSAAGKDREAPAPEREQGPGDSARREEDLDREREAVDMDIGLEL
ncbi:MAG: hypothetical protein OXI73_06635, partial [Rhodospirillales bacterium]|nr:hypothetical protein [Rhodospirillales bacterium]